MRLSARTAVLALAASLLLASCGVGQREPVSLGRGINLGNMLDAPREGAWGVRLDDKLLALVKEAGFDTVRLPVRWSNYAAPTAPYRIDENFFRRVDKVLDEAFRHKLTVVLDMHHHHQLDGDRLEQQDVRVDDALVEERFLAMWRQIAERYRDVAPSRMLFELHNEPHNALTAERWNVLLRKALKVVRATNPARYLVIGPAPYNKVEGLESLSLPFFDRRIIVAVHLYEPYMFTHQGAPWVEGSAKWLGTRCCTEEQRKVVSGFLDGARRWQQWNRRPLWVGEFGSYERADYESRVRYTRFVRGEIEARGFPWAYWELASQFGIYDPARAAWRSELRDALLSRDP